MYNPDDSIITGMDIHPIMPTVKKMTVQSTKKRLKKRKKKLDKRRKI